MPCGNENLRGSVRAARLDSPWIFVRLKQVRPGHRRTVTKGWSGGGVLRLSRGAIVSPGGVTQGHAREQGTGDDYCLYAYAIGLLSAMKLPRTQDANSPARR